MEHNVLKEGLMLYLFIQWFALHELRNLLIEISTGIRIHVQLLQSINQF